MQVLEILEKAKELISTVGWCKENMTDRDANGNINAYCALGAITYAYSDVAACDHRVCLAAEDLFKEANNIPTISGWNDQTMTTKELVLSAFDKAIAAAKEKNANSD